MRVLIIADEEQIDFDRELRADLLISCGDISDSFIIRVSEMTLCREILAVKGNHDSSGPFEAPIKDLHLKVHEFGGLLFGGFNGAWRYKPRGNYLYEQEDVSRQMNTFPAVDVFVAHNSPQQIHEWDQGVHAGFKAFNTYLERVQPPYFIHGHQHVNAETFFGQTRVIGVFGQRWITLPNRRPIKK